MMMIREQNNCLLLKIKIDREKHPGAEYPEK